MAIVADTERLEPEAIRQAVAIGAIVIPANKNHPKLIPVELVVDCQPK